MPEIHRPEDDDEKTLRPGDRLSDAEFIPTAMSPDGAPPLAVAPSDPQPAATPENFVCLRGPCEHFVEITSAADVETKIDGFQPVQKNRYCKVIPGVVLDLVEDNVYECTRWDPQVVNHALSARREGYLKLHSSCAEADAARTARRQEVYAEIEAKADVGKCSACGRSFPVSIEEGERVIAAHVASGNRCPGSTLPPAQE